MTLDNQVKKMDVFLEPFRNYLFNFPNLFPVQTQASVRRDAVLPGESCPSKIKATWQDPKARIPITFHSFGNANKCHCGADVRIILIVVAIVSEFSALAKLDADVLQPMFHRRFKYGGSD